MAFVPALNIAFKPMSKSLKSWVTQTMCPIDSFVVWITEVYKHMFTKN